MKRVAAVVGIVLALAAAWIVMRREPQVSSPSTNAVTAEDATAPSVALHDGSRAAESVRSAPAIAETPREVEAPIAQAQHREERCIGTATLRGFVADEAGLPIEGAELQLMIHAGPNKWDLCGAEAVSDRAGRFELREVAAGSFNGECSHDEFLRTEIPPGVLARDAVVECATIVLRRGLYVAGQVFQPDGTPAPRAELVLTSAGGAEFDTALSKVASTDASANSAELAELLQSLSGDFEMSMSDELADDQGRFRFGPLEDGVYELSATFDPGARTDVPPAMREPATGGVLARARATVKNVRPGGDPLRVVLEPTLRVQGAVVDGDGRAVSAFRVRAERRSTSIFGGLMDGEGTIDAAFESAKGEFELGGFDAGEYEILASTEDGRRSKTQVVRVPQSMPRIEFVLHDNASIAGVVHDSSGNPVPGARVAVRYPGTPSFVWETNQHGATADAAGKFVLSALPPDRVTVDVWADGFQTNESALDMELRPAQVMEGVVLKLERKR